MRKFEAPAAWNAQGRAGGVRGAGVGRRRAAAQTKRRGGKERRRERWGGGRKKGRRGKGKKWRWQDGAISRGTGAARDAARLLAPGLRRAAPAREEAQEGEKAPGKVSGGGNGGCNNNVSVPKQRKGGFERVWSPCVCVCEGVKRARCAITMAGMRVSMVLFELLLGTRRGEAREKREEKEGERHTHRPEGN